jgi:hypothetical protein
VRFTDAVYEVGAKIPAAFDMYVNDIAIIVFTFGQFEGVNHVRYCVYCIIFEQHIIQLNAKLVVLKD